jgi:hypothetical protein
MSLVRIGTVGLIITIFALSFATVLRHTERSRAGLDIQCRVSSNPGCFGPNQR